MKHEMQQEEVRPLARIVARELSAEELASVAGGTVTLGGLTSGHQGDLDHENH